VGTHRLKCKRWKIVHLKLAKVLGGTRNPDGDVELDDEEESCSRFTSCEPGNSATVAIGVPALFAEKKLHPFRVQCTNVMGSKGATEAEREAHIGSRCAEVAIGV
jgi:hypothetical protein